MRVLVTGSTGLVGWTLVQQMPSDWQVFAAVHRNPHLSHLNGHIHPLPLDLTSQRQVREVVRAVQPEVVIHTASVGNLDSSEAAKEMAWKVNVLGTRYLLEACQPYNPHVTFCSTIYVFDGTQPPYAEDAVPAPNTFYGESKLAGERLAQSLSSRLLLLRLNTIYGWHLPGQRTNWVTWLLAKLRAGEPVKAVDDIYNNVVWVGDVAAAILRGIERDVCGLFHVGGPQVLSRYAFSLRIAEVFGYSPALITPVSDDLFAGMVARPKNTACSIQKLRQTLAFNPVSVETGLRIMRQEEQRRLDQVSRMPLSNVA